MTLRIIFCLSIFSIYSYSVFSQGSTYDINQYITPDYKLQTLTIEPGFASNDYWTGEFGSPRAYFKGNINYRLDQYNRKVDRNIYVNLLGQTDNPYGESKGLFNFWLRADQLFYVKPKLFIEYSPRIQYLNTTNSVPDKDLFRFENTASIGIGRKEIISPVWKAKYMLEEILKYQGITIEYSEEDLVLFSNKLIELQKTRIFDNRFKSIFEIENISQYLLDNFPSIEANTSLYVTLSDLYRFEQTRLRRSGKTLALRYKNRYQKFGDSKLTIHSGQLVYSVSKALGENQQLNYEIAIVGALTNNPISRHESISYLDTRASYQYLLNARTNVTFSASLASGYETFGSPFLVSGTFLNLNIYGERFFSNRSILSGSFGLQSNKSTDFQVTNSLQINIEYAYRLL